MKKDIGERVIENTPVPCFFPAPTSASNLLCQLQRWWPKTAKIRTFSYHYNRKERVIL
jgi:hypothetical protein